MPFYPSNCREVLLVLSPTSFPSTILKKNQMTRKHAGARYVHKLSVPGIQFRVVPVSLMEFSVHKTMMYTLEVDRKKPPLPWGVSYLLCSLIKNRE